MTSREKSFAEVVEEQWAEKSEALAEKHLAAAIDAKIAEIDVVQDVTEQQQSCKHDNNIPLSVSNYYSPYVPSNAQRIDAMIELVALKTTDIFVDMGCGDGRVCLVAARLMLERQQKQNQVYDSVRRSVQSQPSMFKFRSIGIDVSSDCIAMAYQQLLDTKHSALLNNIDIASCVAFHHADLTLDPNDILCGMLRIL
jgi:hypothetical protein